jgi:hypothetical protein
MPTEMIPRDYLLQAIKERDLYDDEVLGVAEGTDRLGEYHEGVIDYKGKFYRVEYTWGTAYFMAEVGEWADPLPPGKSIKCTEVTRVTKTITVWENV